VGWGNLIYRITILHYLQQKYRDIQRNRKVWPIHRKKTINRNCPGRSPDVGHKINNLKYAILNI
jgi:hypothetical protein